MNIVIGIVATVLLVFMALFAIRLLDLRADRAEWDRLVALQLENPEHFDPATVADLPEPARRYFYYTILPGAPILPVTQIEMRGQFSLGTKEEPKYQPMEAHQILAAPEGFVWAMRTAGGMPISGSDSGRWTRFRIFGLIPVARLGGDPDHARLGLRALCGRGRVLVPGHVAAGTRCDLGGG